MLVNHIPDRKLFQNKSHIGHLEVHDCRSTFTNRPPHQGEKSSWIGNMFKDVTATVQVARMPGVLLTVEIPNIGHPRRGGALQVAALVARIETTPPTAPLFAEKGEEAAFTTTDLPDFLI